MLKIDELTVAYKSGDRVIPALGPVSFKVNIGEIYAVIGSSGCGKSTLLNALSGVVSNYGGSAIFNGCPISPKKLNISYIPQHYGLLPWKTVIENCLLGLKIKHIKMNEAINKMLSDILNQLKLDELKSRYPNELSGGQRQRVAIARAFMMKPDLLFMDEPFSALDAFNRENAQALFLKLWNKYKVTTIFVTHSIEEALYLGNKIMILSSQPGEIIDIIDNPYFNIANGREIENFRIMEGAIREKIKSGENYED